MEASMDAIKEKRSRVFMNGRSRAVRIPSDFDLRGNEVIMRQEKEGVIVMQEAKPRRTPREMVEWLRSQGPVDFPEIADPQPRPFDLDLPE
jgi:antitoxin VapB